MVARTPYWHSGEKNMTETAKRKIEKAEDFWARKAALARSYEEGKDPVSGILTEIAARTKFKPCTDPAHRHLGYHQCSKDPFENRS